MAYITKDMVTEWGKEAAQQLIEHSVPLNDTLVKIAQDNELNTDQIARLVESANISTHLTVNNSENKYPEFEVANLKKVAEALSSPHPRSKSVSDYDLAPQDFKYSPLEKAAEFEDIDEPENLSPNTVGRIKLALAGLADHYDSKLDEMEQDIYEKAESLKSLVKQAVLDPDYQNSSFSLFKGAALTVTSEQWRPATSAIIADIDTDLQKTCGPLIHKRACAEPTLSEDSVLNIHSEPIQKLGEYLEAFKSYAIARESRDETLSKLAHTELERLGVSEKLAANMSFLEAIGAPFKWVGQGSNLKSKALRAGAVMSLPAIGAAGIATAAHKAGQEKAIEKLAPMQYDKLPQRYKRY